MKKYNFLRGAAFIFEHIFWIFVAWVWYIKTLFRCMNSYSFVESKLILFGIIAISCIVGIIIGIKDKRNGVSVFSNLVMGYGIYTALTYFQIRKSFIITCLLITGVLSVVYAILVLGRKIKNRQHTGQILGKRVVRVASMTQRLMGIGLALIMAVSVGNIFFGSAIMKSGVSTAIQDKIDEQSLSNNMETVVLLQDDTWESLTVQERLDVLQTVANIEQRYLGLPNELNVGAANLNDGMRGYYSDDTHELIIDMDSLLFDSSWEMLNVTCHEAYHSYQYRIAEALNDVDESSKNLRLFRSANSYASEFDNYISGEEDFDNYYYQDCESDAREYAEYAVYNYNCRINEYLLEKEE